MTSTEIHNTINAQKHMKLGNYRVQMREQDGSVKTKVMAEQSLDAWLTIAPEKVISFKKVED